MRRKSSKEKRERQERQNAVRAELPRGDICGVQRVAPARATERVCKRESVEKRSSARGCYIEKCAMRVPVRNDVIQRAMSA